MECNKWGMDIVINLSGAAARTGEVDQKINKKCKNKGGSQIVKKHNKPKTERGNQET